MSSRTLSNLIAEYPAEAEALRRLGELLDRDAREKASREYTLDRLYSKVEPSSKTTLALVLYHLVEAHEVEAVVDVELDGRTIKRLPGVGEVPDVVYDEARDVDVPVTLDHLVVRYRHAKG